jgi:hypothetical protein
MDRINIVNPKFLLGEVVITANAEQQIDPAAVRKGLQRHARGDWGELPAEDSQSNEDAVKYGGRLFSAYGEGDGRFWIITECDHSVTTILLPQDY